MYQVCTCRLRVNFYRKLRDKADVAFKDDMVLKWINHDVRLQAVCGHSDDSLICILDERYMFSGDTLLSIPTVTRLPKGSSKGFWEEDMPMLMKMNVDAVYPGHGVKGCIKDMLNVNIAVRPEKYMVRS